jgi:ankyrin repeat protein
VLDTLGEKENVNCSDKLNLLPVHSAAYFGNFTAIKLLIEEYGAD